MSRRTWSDFASSIDEKIAAFDRIGDRPLQPRERAAYDRQKRRLARIERQLDRERAYAERRYKLRETSKPPRALPVTGDASQSATWTNARQWLDLFTTIRSLGHSRRIREQLENLIIELGERDVPLETASIGVLSDIIGRVRYYKSAAGNGEKIERTRRKLAAAREALRNKERHEHDVLLVSRALFKRLLALEVDDADNVVDEYRGAWHHAIMCSKTRGNHQRVVLPAGRGVRAAATDSFRRMIEYEDVNPQRGRAKRIKAIRALLEKLADLDRSAR